MRRALLLATLVAGIAIPSALADPVTVYVANYSTVVPQPDLLADLPAFQTAVSRDLQSVWGVDAVLTTDPSQAQMVDNLIDYATCTGCLGQHGVVKGIPTADVYVQTSADFREAWTLVFTHELFEMLVDPWINRFALWNKKQWLVEDADPVESGFYAYFIGAVAISDFITPAWYGSLDGKMRGPFDFTRKLKRAGQIGKKGYASWLGPSGWGQVFG